MNPSDIVNRLAAQNVENGGRPFACAIVKDGKVVAAAPNLVVQTNDPTAHAEIVAIREACVQLGTESLAGCVIYVLAHPCPMCLAALYYCGPDEVVFSVERDDYESHYRDDRRYFKMSEFYDEFSKHWTERQLPMRMVQHQGDLSVFQRWAELN